MKKVIIALAATIFTVQVSLAQGSKTPAPKKTTTVQPTPKPAAGDVAMKNSLDSLSYAIGVNIAGNLKQQNLKVNTALLAKAIDQILSNQSTAMDPNACNVYIQSYFQNEMMKKAEINQKAGEKFLAANKTKAGVITLPSGLQYEVIKQGIGAKPVPSDKIRVHYHGTLTDGIIFDSSVERGQPAEMLLSQFITGWVEAFQLMPVGSKWKLYIPANLAYGPQGPPSIGPNQVLVFEVELLDIVK